MNWDPSCSLFLSSDDYDLVYGAYWLSFGDYVKNGGYKGFDWDFVEKYMPITAKTQAPTSWREMKFGDLYYGITNSINSISANGVWTRQSILDKYGFQAEDIKNDEDLMQLMDAIAADTSSTRCVRVQSSGYLPAGYHVLVHGEEPHDGRKRRHRHLDGLEVQHWQGIYC